MYPNLYYAFKDLFGVDWGGLRFINSFGFFVALSFLAAAWVLTRELKRKERASRDARMAKLIQGGKFPYTPAVQSWVSTQLGVPFSQVTEEQATAPSGSRSAA